jgi:hypothetical protein
VVGVYPSEKLELQGVLKENSYKSQSSSEREKKTLSSRKKLKKSLSGPREEFKSSWRVWF